jgi:FKBP-type peptidyl-prolyl cis-trans isomerase
MLLHCVCRNASAAFLAAVVVALLAGAAAAQTTPAGQAQAPPAAPADVAAVPADAAKTASGLASRVVTPGTGTEKPLATDIVTVHYTGWTTTGTVVDSSVVRGMPAMFALNRAGLLGWRECVQMMTIGETRRCWLPQELAYRGQAGRPTGMVVFDIELIDTRRPPNVAPSDVAAPPDDAKRTATGIAYKVLKPGSGTRRPTAFDTVVVHYTGWTTNGQMFDTTLTKGAPVALNLGDVIRGWTEGMQLMTIGDRVRFWIPQDLAYKGEPGSPRGMLVFDIDLVGIQ